MEGLRVNLGRVKPEGQGFYITEFDLLEAHELPLTDVLETTIKAMCAVSLGWVVRNPTGYVDTDFTGGSVKAVYRLDQNGSANLHTLSPNPKS